MAERWGQVDISGFFSIAYRNGLTQMAASPSFQSSIYFIIFSFLGLVGFLFVSFFIFFFCYCAKLNTVLTPVLRLGEPTVPTQPAPFSRSHHRGRISPSWPSVLDLQWTRFVTLVWGLHPEKRRPWMILVDCTVMLYQLIWMFLTFNNELSFLLLLLFL